MGHRERKRQGKREKHPQKRGEGTPPPVSLLPARKGGDTLPAPLPLLALPWLPWPCCPWPLPCLPLFPCPWPGLPGEGRAGRAGSGADAPPRGRDGGEGATEGREGSTGEGFATAPWFYGIARGEAEGGAGVPPSPFSPSFLSPALFRALLPSLAALPFVSLPPWLADMKNPGLVLAGVALLSSPCSAWLRWSGCCCLLGLAD